MILLQEESRHVRYTGIPTNHPPKWELYRCQIQEIPEIKRFIRSQFESRLKPTKKIAREFGFKNQTGCFDPMQGGISLQKKPGTGVLSASTSIQHCMDFLPLLIQYNPSLFITLGKLTLFRKVVLKVCYLPK